MLGLSRRGFAGLLVLVVFLGLVAYYAYNYYNTRDSDGDGIPDVDEVSKYHTNPNSRDTDSDGLTDYHEIFAYHTDPLKPDPNVKYALDLGLEKYIDVVKPLDSDGVQDDNEKQFIELMANSEGILGVPSLMNYLGEASSDGGISGDELKYLGSLVSWAKGLYGEVSGFYFTSEKGQRVYIDDKTGVTNYALNLVLKLGLNEKAPSNTTVKAVAYYGVAVKADNLPEDLEALSLLVRGARTVKYGSYLVDFDPLVIVDAKGNTIVIESRDRARDTWMIAYLLKQRPELVEQPKKFEWINRMIQQVAWNIFDDEYGPSFFDKKAYYPTDKDVWDVILGFHDYMDNLPSKMEKDGLPIFFHYWDSDLLEREIPDKTNRTFALLFLGNLPNKAYDRDTYQVVAGMDGLKLFVKRLSQMYDWVVNAWKNPGSKEHEYAMVAYRMWLQDRKVHGLENTVRQFSGVWPFEQEGTIDDFLNKNFFAWKFAKFPYAYLSGRFYWSDSSIPNYGEWEMYAYELPLAYKSVGIPLGQMGGFGTSGNLGGPGNYGHGEFGIYGIPQSVIDALLAAQKSLGRIAVGYGNGVSMMSAIDGFEKDSGYEILHGIRRINIYLWKKE